VSASLLYYCAGVKEEGEKEKRPVNNLEGEKQNIFCKRVPL